MKSGIEVSLTSLLSLMMMCTVLAGIPKPKSRGSIELISLTPEAGSPVDRHTVIRAELRFKIDNFKDKKGRYQISVKFQSRESRSSTFSKGEDSAVMLEEPAGTITLEYPLESIWDNPRLRKPLVIYFYLHERTGRHQSIVLDSTDDVQFLVPEPGQPAS